MAISSFKPYVTWSYDQTQRFQFELDSTPEQIDQVRGLLAEISY